MPDKPDITKEAVMAKVQNLSEMLAKRKEELGSNTRFEWPVDDDKSFWVLDPRLATDEFQDDLADLTRQFQNGKFTPSEYAEDVVSMFLDDEEQGLHQSDDYLDMFDDFPSPLTSALELLQDTVKSWTEQTDPTRQSSRSTRRQSKRR